ncbi:MAG: MlaA family lipoprotein [Alphaproteobacteria bacterium]
MDLIRSLAAGWQAVTRRVVLVVLACSLAGACASNPHDTTNDPIEGLNRHVFAFNGAVDTALIKPAAVIYREAVPRPLKDMLENFLDNLTMPLTIIHDLLQGKPERAQVAFGRFFLNTVVGVGGLFDIATPTGFVLHKEDAGQTLAVHGVDSGPYLVLPLLGPSSVRDATGTLVDFVIDPVGLASYGLLDSKARTIFGASRSGATAIVQREKLIEPLDALSDSLDYYATIRAAYRQRRAIDIRDGNPVAEGEKKVDPFASFEDDAKPVPKAATH